MNTASKAARAVARLLKKQSGQPELSHPLSLPQRRIVVESFTTLLEGLYTHLPQKRATYGLDPVQRLRSLYQRLDQMNDTDFHRSMAEIITQLRDAHTRYLGPKSEAGKVAVLPFLVERYEDFAGEHYIASKVFNGNPEQMDYFEATGFEQGVEITHWNGIGIDRAVELYAERETGGRPDVRRARALESLTLRPLRYALPPDEDWVIVSFAGRNGPGEIKLEWRNVTIHDLPNAASNNVGMAQLAYAGDSLAETARRVKKMLFSPDVWYESQAKQRTKADKASPQTVSAVRPDDFSDAVYGETWSSPDGVDVGYLRLWSFDLVNDDGFIQHVIDLLQRMPPTGLIIDLRGNPGGLIWAAERLLQLFTPNPVEPVRFSLLATDISRIMAGAPQNELSLAPWRSSLESAVISGELHSRAVPLTPVGQCNNVGQKYPGPVIAVVDASTYSSGDLFAAGFVDNNIGMLVSVDQATGAGGANVWRYNHVMRSLDNTEAMPPILPAGIEYTLAIRRATRVGEALGTSIEDKGIPGHIRRPLTKVDLQHANRDLKTFCSRLLASESLTNLQYTFDNGELTVRTENLDRIELYLDERPFGVPAQIHAQSQQPTISNVGRNWSKLEILGFAGDSLLQRRLLWPDSVT